MLAAKTTAITTRMPFGLEIDTHNPKTMYAIFFGLREARPLTNFSWSLSTSALIGLLNKPAYEINDKQVTEPKTESSLPAWLGGKAALAVNAQDNDITFPRLHGGKPSSWLAMLVHGFNQSPVATLEIKLKLDASTAETQFRQFVNALSYLNNPAVRGPATAEVSPPMLSLDLTECSNLSPAQIKLLVDLCRFNVIKLPCMPSIGLEQFYTLDAPANRQLVVLHSSKAHWPTASLDVMMWPTQSRGGAHTDRSIVLIDKPAPSRTVTEQESLGKYMGGIGAQTTSSSRLHTKGHVLKLLATLIREGRILSPAESAAFEQTAETVAQAGETTRRSVAQATRASVAAAEKTRVLEQIRDATAELARLKAGDEQSGGRTRTTLQIFSDPALRAKVIGTQTLPDSANLRLINDEFYQKLQKRFLNQAAQELVEEWAEGGVNYAAFKAHELRPFMDVSTREKAAQILIAKWRAQEIADSDYDADPLKNTAAYLEPSLHRGIQEEIAKGPFSPGRTPQISAAEPPPGGAAARVSSVTAAPAAGEGTPTGSASGAGRQADAVADITRTSASSSQGRGSASALPFGTGANPRPGNIAAAAAGIGAALQQRGPAATATANGEEELAVAPAAAPKSAQKPPAAAAGAPKPEHSKATVVLRPADEAARHDAAQPLLPPKEIDFGKGKTRDERLLVMPWWRDKYTGGCACCPKVMAIPEEKRVYKADPSPTGLNR